ncbi:MAG: hypothetical protein AB8B97_19410 [Granulosicoccus sp.]
MEGIFRCLVLKAISRWAGHRSLADHLQNDVQNLLHSIEAVRPDELADAALHLARADKIWVVGFGENYPLAHFARALLIRIKPDIRMIPIGGFSVPASHEVLSECILKKTSRVEL